MRSSMAAMSASRWRRRRTSAAMSSAARRSRGRRPPVLDRLVRAEGIGGAEAVEGLKALAVQQRQAGEDPESKRSVLVCLS